MIITVQGTPEECETLCNVLKGAQAASETPISITVVQPNARTPLTVIQGGQSKSRSGDRRKVELPPI